MVLVPPADDWQECDAFRHCLLGVDLALGVVLHKNAGRTQQGGPEAAAREVEEYGVWSRVQGVVQVGISTWLSR